MKVTFGKVQPPKFTDDFISDVFLNGKFIGTLTKLEGSREWHVGTDLEERYSSLSGVGGMTIHQLRRYVRETILEEIQPKSEDALIDEGIKTGHLPPDWKQFVRSMEFAN